MPIAIISVDSANSQLKDFKDLVTTFDRVYVSNTRKAADIYMKIVTMADVAETKFTSLLDEPINETPEEVRNRFQSIVDKCSGGYACIIISYHSVINTWKPNFIDDEWAIV